MSADNPGSNNIPFKDPKPTSDEASLAHDLSPSTSAPGTSSTDNVALNDSQSSNINSDASPQIQTQTQTQSKSKSPSKPKSNSGSQARYDQNRLTTSSSITNSNPNFNSSNLVSAYSHTPSHQNSPSSQQKSVLTSTPEGNNHSANAHLTHVQDPFNSAHVKVYSHKANIIPPYVLDRLTQAHYKDQLDNTNVNNNQADINPSLKKKTSNQPHFKEQYIEQSFTNANEDEHPNNNLNNQSNGPQNRQSLNQPDDETQFMSFSNDPFIKSLGDNKWQNFLSTIQQPTAYTSDLVNFDNSFNKEEARLNEAWGGDDRLKLALLGSPSSDEDTYVGEENSSIFTKFFGKKKSINTSGKLIKDNDHPKVRSKAGYWMSDEKRADLLPTLKRLFVQNPLVPLFLRILILIFSACALALACTIFVYSRKKYHDQKIEQQPSTIMAIVVQCCAIVYVIYISYDEYSGKPLGLRDPLGKMKLIMLDLLFIIFSSSNLSLTFNTLYDDEWVCQDDNTPILANIGIYYPTVYSICRRQRALASFLFLVLCLWVVTFTISIIRVVDRVSVPTPRND